LQALSQVIDEKNLKNQRALDFGSGSGILSIAMALKGLNVDGVEIDPLAIENAQENSVLNHVANKVNFVTDLSNIKQKLKYPLVVANILRPVLLEYKQDLVKMLADDGSLILSGLIESDVSIVVNAYKPLLKKEAKVTALNEWRAIVF